MWTGRQTLYGISLMTLLCMAFYGYGKLSFQKSIVQDSAEIIKLFASSYNCTQEMAKLNAETVEQDDPRLINAIKRCYLEPPSRLPYNLANPNRPDYSQAGQANYVDNLQKHAKNGFFVESGAFDGETLSNSLLFELHRNWTGLLIEPLSAQFNKLRRKHRKAFIIKACLSKDPYPIQVQLEISRMISRVVENNQSSAGKDLEIVQCFPIYSILLATGRTRIDFFSLDIEGYELAALRTIPWHAVDIKVLMVEYNHIKEGKRALVDFMTANGYKTLPLIYRRSWQDIVFVKNGFEYDKKFIATLSRKPEPHKQ